MLFCFLNNYDAKDDNDGHEWHERMKQNCHIAESPGKNVEPESIAKLYRQMFKHSNVAGAFVMEVHSGCSPSKVALRRKSERSTISLGCTASKTTYKGLFESFLWSSRGVLGIPTALFVWKLAWSAIPAKCQIYHCARSKATLKATSEELEVAMLNSLTRKPCERLTSQRSEEALIKSWMGQASHTRVLNWCTTTNWSCKVRQNPFHAMPSWGPQIVGQGKLSETVCVYVCVCA